MMFQDIDTSLTEEHRVLKDAAHRFARDVIRPAARDADTSPGLDYLVHSRSPWWEAKRQARRLGYHLAALPRDVGGLGADPLSMHILLEEFGWGSPGLALSIFADAFPAVAALVHKPGCQRLLDDIVAPFVTDTEAGILSCAAFSEPDHGSDTLFCFTGGPGDAGLAFDTRATPADDGWIINGQKAAWVSNGAVATQALVWLTVRNADGQARGGGMAIVPLDSPGVSRGSPTVLLGSRDFPQCALFFDDVHIPAEYLLVGPEDYVAAADNFLNLGGLAVGIAFLGLARAAFEEALTYAGNRIQGGKPLTGHQAVQLRLFDMFTKIEAGRALSRQAMRFCVLPHGRVPIEYSTAVKIYCTRIAYEVAHDAVQIHGACGLGGEMLVEKLFRDARGGLIGDGCNDALSLKRSHDLIANYQP